jgi:hypothetical protein
MVTSSVFGVGLKLALNTLQSDFQICTIYYKLSIFVFSFGLMYCNGLLLVPLKYVIGSGVEK